MAKDQFEFIIEYLKKENIRIDFDEYKFQTETHPDYPSLLAFSESLSFFNVDNLATRIPKDQWENLPNRFIALLEPEGHASFLALVERKSGGFEYLLDGNLKFINLDNFMNLWSGIVLVAEQTNDTLQSSKKGTSFSKIILFIAVLLVVLFALTSAITPVVFAGFGLLSISGIFLALEALKQEFGVKSSVTSGVCNASANTDCHAVITSENVKLLGILGLSDISIIYFSSQLLALLIFGLNSYQTSFTQLTLISLGIAVPIIVFSIYYQLRVAKKWCPVCLGIAGVIVIQLLVLMTSQEAIFSNVSVVGLFLVASIYLFFLAAWLQIKPFFKEFFDLKSAKLEAMRFRRNYTLFKNTLKTEKQVESVIMNSPLTLGNSSAHLRISLITNPFCRFCEGAHRAIHDIVKRNGMDVAIFMRFNINTDKADKTAKLLHQGFVEIFENQGADALLEAMDFWFANKDAKQWLSKYRTSTETDPRIMRLLQDQYMENARNELMFTPAIIVNTYQYPTMYRPMDLPGFISELEEDSDLIAIEGTMEIL
ncbi:vitamin K epoxide reductase family protein [Flavobacteriaceae bacterium M23B6Z8]